MAQHQVTKLPVRLIDPDPAQPRKRFNEATLRELGQTLLRGQAEAVQVWKVGPRYRLRNGERRWRAAQLMGLESMDAIVLDGPMPDAASELEMQLISSIQREDLNPIDIANAIERLIELSGQAAGAVAARLGKSPGYVSKLLTLRLLPGEVQDRVANGQLALSTAYELAKVADSGERSRLIEEAAQGRLTRDAAVAKTKSLAKDQKPRKPRVRRVRRVVFRLDGNRSVAVCGPALTLNLVLHWVGELFATLTSANAGGLALEDVITPAGK